MTHNKTAALGEAKALFALVEQGYDVFTQFDGKAPFDFVAHKDGRLIRVEVKATNDRKGSGKFEVDLTTTTHRKGGVSTIHFDSSLCDLLMVYVPEEDTLVELDPSKLDGRRSIRVSAEQ